MSAQELFNKIVVHLRVQGRKSQRYDTIGADGFQCAYKSKNGDKCAIGRLIPDEDYDSKMEGRSIHQLMDLDPFNLIFKNLLPHQDLLNELQIIHDKEDVFFWENAFTKIARIFNLSLSSDNEIHFDDSYKECLIYEP